MSNVNIFQVLENSKVGCTFLNCDLYEEFAKNIDDEKEIIKKIEEYNNYMENNNNKYSEQIMRYLRQRVGLGQFDFSKDKELNRMSPNEVFENVVRWNGLLGSYHATIKSWIKEIYGIDLNNIK